MKIFIAGGTGMLGSSLKITLRNAGHEVIVHGLSSNSDIKADLRNFEDTKKTLSNFNPDLVINLVALTSVEKCEAFPNMAFELNCLVARNLKNWCLINGKKLIYISTDHIYDDIIPSNEDNIKILNYYAFSKYAGELESASENSVILRTNFVGKSKNVNRQSLSDWVFENLKKNKQVEVLSDVFFSPLSINMLSEYILLVIAEEDINGTFNLGCKGYMSKANFDIKLGKLLGHDCSNMQLIESNNASFLKAVRPKGMAMNTKRFSDSYNVKLPSIEDVLIDVSKEYL